MATNSNTKNSKESKEQAGNISALEKENKDLKQKVKDLKNELSNLTKPNNETYVVINGERKEVHELDTVWEISDKLKKRYIDEDQLCVVVKR